MEVAGWRSFTTQGTCRLALAIFLCFFLNRTCVPTSVVLPCVHRVRASVTVLLSVSAARTFGVPYTSLTYTVVDTAAAQYHLRNFSTGAVAAVVPDTLVGLASSPATVVTIGITSATSQSVVNPTTIADCPPPASTRCQVDTGDGGTSKSGNANGSATVASTVISCSAGYKSTVALPFCAACMHKIGVLLAGESSRSSFRCCCADPPLVSLCCLAWFVCRRLQWVHPHRHGLL